jgi:chromosome partitioning protein
MVIAFVNHKGGVGKTTCTLNIGAGLRRQGKSVLLIDADAQANLTLSMGLKDRESITLYEAMTEKNTLQEAIIRREDSFDIIPACLDLCTLELELSTAFRREEILKSLLESIRQDYDYILIDCPPALDICTRNVLAATDTVYIPVSAEILPMYGLSKIVQIIEKIRAKRINPNLVIGGVIVTRYNKQQRICQDVYQMLVEMFNEKVFRTCIRENVALKEYSAAHQDIFTYAPNSLAASDYQHLLEEIIERTNAEITNILHEGSVVA